MGLRWQQQKDVPQKGALIFQMRTSRFCLPYSTFYLFILETNLLLRGE
jgi:hypothetical protein